MLGHWLHFGYAEQMDMDISVWEMFIKEVEKLIEESNRV